MPAINSEPSSIAKLGPKPGRSRDARTGRHRRSIPTFKKTAIKSHSRENSSHSPTLLSIKHTHNEHRRRLHHLGISFEKRSIRPLSRNTAPTKSRQTIPNIISSSTRHRKQLGEVIPIPAPMTNNSHHDIIIDSSSKTTWRGNTNTSSYVALLPPTKRNDQVNKTPALVFPKPIPCKLTQTSPKKGYEEKITGLIDTPTDRHGMRWDRKSGKATTTPRTRNGGVIKGHSIKNHH